jgi:MinD superfamily P-loop ATPase
VKEIVILSGKGGTGKTTLSSCFSYLNKNSVIVDCDVDAANLHLTFEPEIVEKIEFIGGKQASVITDRCIGCGKCLEVCKFDAVFFDGPANDFCDKTYTIDHLFCEGCKVCYEFCPAKAISFEDAVNGHIYISKSMYGPFVHAVLGPGEENSGKLVARLKKMSKEIAEKEGIEHIITDASPGIGCPVIASLSGADVLLAVTEPTLSGMHDLKRIIDLAKHFQLKIMVCINKWDINEEITNQIINYLKENSIENVGNISFSKKFVKANVDGKIVLEYNDADINREIESVFIKTMDFFNKKKEN